MKLTVPIFLGIFYLVLGWTCTPVQAGVLEFSGTFSFSSTSYGGENFQWVRRWSGSIGYFFWAQSEIEFSAQDVLYRTRISGVQDTSFHDQIYSVDFVQSLAPKTFWLQPYLKAGVGQLYRQANGTYSEGITPPAIYASLTAVVGAGLRIFLSRSFAVKAEGSSYLTGGSIATWQDNVAVSGGFSLYL